MMASQKRRSPAGTGLARRTSYGPKHSTTARDANARVPHNWRERLPDPTTYYASQVTKLGKANANGWAQGVCPFHDDHNASLSVNVSEARGGWRCFASCGGGDLVGFHIKRTGLGFREAVRDLIRGHA